MTCTLFFQDPPESSILDVMDDQVIVALKKTFRFDKIFDENSCQSNVYSNLVQPIVEKVSFPGTKK